MGAGGQQPEDWAAGAGGQQPEDWATGAGGQQPEDWAAGAGGQQALALPAGAGAQHAEAPFGSKEGSFRPGEGNCPTCCVRSPMMVKCLDCDGEGGERGAVCRLGRAGCNLPWCRQRCR